MSKRFPIPVACAFAVLAVIATPVGGCTSLIGSASAAPSLADAEKALTLAHLAYQGAGLALVNAAKSGALHGPAAAQAKALYDQAGAALDAADAADAAANAPDLLTAVARANALIAQLRAVIPQK